MKLVWIYFLLSVIVLKANAQPGIGLINTEMDGPLGTGKQILKSYTVSSPNNCFESPTESLNPLQSQYHQDSVRIPRKIDKIYNLKLILKRLLSLPFTWSSSY